MKDVLIQTDTLTLTLRPKEEGRLQAGHLWVFSNELQTIVKTDDRGVLADLEDARGNFLARGFYNPHSLIAFRSLTSQKETIDAGFLEKRLREALALRERLYPGQTAYRWVFGESDALPGLIVDRYGENLSIQALSAGMERLQGALLEAILCVAACRGVVWRSDAPLRELEGLPVEPPKILHGHVPPRVDIRTENGVFSVDLLGGQKSGFYFDQRDNRQALAGYSRGKKVLDAFCYSGGFGIVAARGGAREVVFNDSSEAALELAEANVKANGVAAPAAFVHGDALKLLEHTAPGGPFEVIALDPPAYAKSKKHLPVALKAYEKLNALAMTALARGGILATSSCSHHVPRELFVEMLRHAARKARRTVRLLELRGQAKDHPVLLAMPETEYLKCAILEVR